MNIMKIAMIGIVGVLLAIQLKQYKAEYAIYLTIAVSIFILFQIVGHLEVVIGTMQEISQSIQVEIAYIGTLLKILGITYIAEFASGICKDAGYQTIASQIELFSKLTILVLSLPILLTLLNTIQGFLG